MRGKGEGSVYRDKTTGLYTASIELPAIDGKRRRKKIRRKTRRAVLDELARLQKDLKDRGDLPSADQTVEQWFRHWLPMAKRDVRPNTFDNYAVVTRKYIVPVIGKVKLEKVSPAHVRRVSDWMLDQGLSSTYAQNAHRVMSTAFEAAVRENRLSRNPAKQTKAPRRDVVRLEVLTVPEARVVIGHASRRTPEGAFEDPLGARWITALLTGARRGEILGLQVDRVTDILDLSWQLQRITWSHGCAGTCGRKRGTDCPQRRIEIPTDYEVQHLTGGLYLTRPKSSAGYRVIPLVEPLRSILAWHMMHQPPNRYGLVFAIDGEPIDPSRNSADWKQILDDLGIEKNVRLHDVRHTTADLLYEAGVPEDLIVEILGHSTRHMSRAYKSRGNSVRLVQAMEALSDLVMQVEPADRRRAVGS